MKTRILFLLLAFMGVFGCEKNLNISQAEFRNQSGLVLYTGDPAVDGCDWLIKVDTVFLKPVNLDSYYKKDNLQVKLNFDTLSTRWQCGWREPGYQEIQITRISRK
jgi:hypothetical protein